MTLFSLPLGPDDVRAFLSRGRSQIRVPITSANSYVDGCVAPKLYAALVWDSHVYVDPGPSPAGNRGPYLHVPHGNGDSVHRVYPRWQPGDRITVKERWADADCMYQEHVNDAPSTVAYEADKSAILFNAKRPMAVPAFDLRSWNWDRLRWRAAQTMPRDFSRLSLDVLSIRAVHLCDVTTADILAEGIEVPDVDYNVPERPDVLDAERDAYAREAFRTRWDASYGKNAPWSQNRWTWAFTVKAKRGART